MAQVSDSIRQQALKSLKTEEDKLDFDVNQADKLYKWTYIPEKLMKETRQSFLDKGYSEDELAQENKDKVEAKNEWIAARTIDFMNQVSDFWKVVNVEYTTTFIDENEGFPPGFLYEVHDRDVNNGSEYINATLDYIDELFDDSEVFPCIDTDPFPANFIDLYIKKIYLGLLRIYAIYFSHCVEWLEKVNAKGHLISSFRRFYFFARRYDLIKEMNEELKAFDSQNVKQVLNLEKLAADYENTEKCLKLE